MIFKLDQWRTDRVDRVDKVQGALETRGAPESLIKKSIKDSGAPWTYTKLLICKNLMVSGVPMG